MNWVYIRDVESGVWDYDAHKQKKARRKFKPLGLYCKYCELFCTDEQYPELLAEQDRIRELDENEYYKHHIGIYHLKDPNERQRRSILELF